LAGLASATVAIMADKASETRIAFMGTSRMDLMFP
jgi:hypothetical protein